MPVQGARALQRPHTLEPANFNAGLERILFGLVTKTLIAGPIAPWCAPGGCLPLSGAHNAPESALDEASKERLRSLGYVR